MEGIRRSVATIVAEDERQLTERQAREQSANRRLQRILVMLGLTILALMALLTERFVRGVTHSARMEQEAQFQALVDGMPTLCWMADADGWIFWYSRGWYDYTGTTPQQMEGWGWQAVHDPETLPRVLDRWKDSIASGETFEMTFPLRGADGEYRTFLTRATPLRGPNRRVLRWYGANTDVTEAQRTREMLERMVEERTASLVREVEERRVAEEALRQSEKLQLLGQFTGGIAHDFNNVLQVVTSGVGLLRSPRLTPERRDRLLQEMERSARNAAEMVSRLLSFARRQVLTPQAFDANEHLRGMTDMLGRTLGARITVKTDLAPDLWPVLADPNQFEVAVLNLAVNARDAMPSGGTITLRTRNDAHAGMEGEVWITVEDTGTGMPPEVRARVFEPFFTTKDVGKGTGLGLPQVQGFAHQSGGDARIDSEPGGGTKVTLCLPRTPMKWEGEQAPAFPAPGADLPGPGLPGANTDAAEGKRHVLVVEDNPEVAAFAITILEGMNHAVTHAPNAPEALTRIESGEPVDAVFSDVVMPGHINGAELASILCLRHPRIAVIMATGYTDQRDRLRGLPVEVLDKPYTIEALTAAMNRALHRRPVPRKAMSVP